jgi:hypothetical protein
MSLRDLASIFGTVCASALGTPATQLFAASQRGPRRPYVILQFDDGSITHFTGAWPILEQHGFRGSFGIVTGNVGNPWSMSGSMLRELRDAGCSFQDHTKDHNAAKWGSAVYSAQWGADIEFSRRVFADSVGISPMTAWNQPGGSGEGWTTELGDTLAAYGYRYTAGAVALTNSQWQNFHYGFIDNPYRLGRFVFSWGYNAPSGPSWTWQAEVEAIKTRIADGVAQGVIPQLVFHGITAEVAGGLSAICDWLDEEGITPLTMDDAFDLVTASCVEDYGQNLAPSLAVDRDANGRPDAWGSVWTPVGMDGSAVNGVSTMITGPPAGRLVCSWTLSEPLLGGSPDEFTIQYEKTKIDPVTFAHSVAAASRTLTILPGEVLSWADTLEILPYEHVDRVKATISGVWRTPFVIHAFTAVPAAIPTEVRDRTPGASDWLRIGPNPASDVVRVTCSLANAGPVVISVYSVTGALVERLTDHGNQHGRIEAMWHTGTVPSGIYFIKVRSDHAVLTRKVVIVR